MLFQPPHEELTDEEIAAVLRDVIAGAGRLPRHVDVYLARASGGRPQGRWADRGAAGAVADAPVRRSLPVKVALSDCCRPNLLPLPGSLLRQAGVKWESSTTVPG